MFIGSPSRVTITGHRTLLGLYYDLLSKNNWIEKSKTSVFHRKMKMPVFSAVWYTQEKLFTFGAWWHSFSVEKETCYFVNWVKVRWPVYTLVHSLFLALAGQMFPSFVMSHQLYGFSLFYGSFFGLYDYFIPCIFAHNFDNRCHHLELSQNTV